jgi:hypothetical protein
MLDGHPAAVVVANTGDESARLWGLDTAVPIGELLTGQIQAAPRR